MQLTRHSINDNHICWKLYLQSTSRQNYPLFCLMISRLGCLCHRVFLFFISTTYPPSSEARACSCFDFSFFCLLPIHVAIWRPSLHLHPTACRRIWPLIGQMLHAVNHCGNACGVRLLVFFFLSCLAVTQSSTRASLQWCASFAHLQRMHPFAQNGAPHGSWDRMPSAWPVCREGRHLIHTLFREAAF